jgi:hypothetical protein
MAMAVSPMPTQEPIGTSRLEVVASAAVSRTRAAAVLAVERGLWLGELVEPAVDQAGAARYLLDLELRVSDLAPRVSFRKAAFVDVGPLDASLTGPLVVDIAWRAAGLTPLFPVFAGTLSWQDGELRLNGVYAPPGGAVGAVADRLLLNVAARGTGRRLLERIAAAMGEGERR